MKRILACLICFVLVLSAPMPISASENLLRLYNPNSGEHFYTSNSYERDMLVNAGWKYEGPAWTAGGSLPVYRLYNPNAGDHHYTLDANEKNHLVKVGWRYEGIGWYSPKTGIPVYRCYNPNAKSGAHHFTIDKNEYDYLGRVGWHKEGIAWQAEGTGASVGLSAKANGPLSVKGTRLVNQKGQPVTLQGVSTHGLAWYPAFVNQNLFTELHTTWNVDVIRLALYTEEYGGWCSGGNRTQLLDLVEKGISYAKTADMYCIVDWHILSDGNPLSHVEEAKAFFSSLSAKHKNDTHILYEICNEPNGGTSWEQIKAYANQVIPVIRANDPDAVIIVGTPTWSQDVDAAARSPLPYSNLLYALHFYAGTHKTDLQNKLVTALNAGLPVFVSEFGISDASGNGAADTASGNTWIALLNRYGIGRVAWSLSNKAETCSLFTGSKTAGFTQNDLSTSGKWLYQTYTGKVSPSASASSSSSSSSAASYAISAVNSWTSNGKTYTQYAITIKNAGRAGWKVQIPFSGPITLNQGWNGKFSVSGNKLVITNESWNATDVGCIIESAAGIKPQ